MRTLIDFKTIDRSARHAIFFALFEGLQDGESFEFVNDHNPVPLFNQIQTLNLSNLQWSYEEKGPESWRIRITKTRSSNAGKESSCCGGGKSPC